MKLGVFLSKGQDPKRFDPLFFDVCVLIATNLCLLCLVSILLFHQHSMKPLQKLKLRIDRGVCFNS